MRRRGARRSWPRVRATRAGSRPGAQQAPLAGRRARGAGPYRALRRPPLKSVLASIAVLIVIHQQRKRISRIQPGSPIIRSANGTIAAYCRIILAGRYIAPALKNITVRHAFPLQVLLRRNQIRRIGNMPRKMIGQYRAH